MWLWIGTESALQSSTERWLTPNPLCARCLEKTDKMEEKGKKETVLKVIRQRIISLIKKAGVPNIS